MSDQNQSQPEKLTEEQRLLQVTQLCGMMIGAINEYFQQQPAMQGADRFAITYECGFAICGQLLGAAFAQNPGLNQEQMLMSAGKTLAYHTDEFHKRFLADAAKAAAAAAASQAPETLVGG